MSAAEAVDATSKRLGLWTWATPEARAKREAARAIATRFVDGITPGMSEEARAAHVAGAVAEAIAAFPPPPLALKVPEFKEITDPGALAPSLEWLAAAPAPIYFPSPIDLGGAYGEGGQAEPVEGEPATPTLLDTWEEGPQPEFEVIRMTAEDLELKERNQARSAARAAGH
jgi:hypothetical protein